ncbi:MAG: rhodanese-like domain-containing protein [Chitinophagales bacterium]
MIVEQLYTHCLAEAAYYIESDGEAAIIDPLRDSGPYLARAAKNGASIKYIFETHFHADFVSGHRELAEKTNAAIVFGNKAMTGFEAILAEDGQTFQVGKLRIVALHTPGHTLESTSYLLLNEEGKAHCIFTGDTLFIGDVGRPDLAVKSDLTMEQLAGMLYDSLHQKIMALPDDVIIYPAHGAGSACGKNMSKETFDTLGNQKQVNYALKAPNKETFIGLVTSGLTQPPAYFPANVQMNKEGATGMQEIYANGLKPLQPNDFNALMNNADTIVLDVRKPAAFCSEHIPDSISIGLDGQFAPWLGAVMDIHKNYLLVCDTGREEETVMRMARVGFDRVVGYLDGGVTAWKKAGFPTASITSLAPEEYTGLLQDNTTPVLDVRRPGEYDSGHLPQAQLYPLDDINQWINSLDKSHPWYVHCAGGYRSVIAASVMKKAGYAVSDIAGGFASIKKAGLPIVTEEKVH